MILLQCEDEKSARKVTSQQETSRPARLVTIFAYVYIRHFLSIASKNCGLIKLIKNQRRNRKI